MPSLRTCLLSSLLVAASACVNVDPETGEVLPRGGQRYKFSEVVENVDDLEVGMTRRQVLFLLGSPAETDHRNTVWVYLPERPAVLVPGRALRLEFKDGALADFGYHGIVLGERL